MLDAAIISLEHNISERPQHRRLEVRLPMLLLTLQNVWKARVGLISGTLITARVAGRRPAGAIAKWFVIGKRQMSAKEAIQGYRLLFELSELLLRADTSGVDRLLTARSKKPPKSTTRKSRDNRVCSTSHYPVAIIYKYKLYAVQYTAPAREFLISKQTITRMIRMTLSLYIYISLLMHIAHTFAIECAIKMDPIGRKCQHQLTLPLFTLRGKKGQQQQVPSSFPSRHYSQDGIFCVQQQSESPTRDDKSIGGR